MTSVQTAATSFPSVIKQTFSSAEEITGDEHTCRTELSDGFDLSSSHFETIPSEDDGDASSEDFGFLSSDDDADGATTARIGLEPQHAQNVEEAQPTRVSMVPRSSILKKTLSEPIPINPRRGCWKVLPCPDMTTLNRGASDPGDSSRGVQPTRKERLGVAFVSVHIREYSQTVGDNPSVSYGPPISLDWSYEEFEPISIDQYEDKRGRRRCLRQMILSYYHRRNVLSWQYGFSDEELKAAKKQANKIKFQRAITAAFLPAMTVEAALESAGRKAKRLAGGKGKQRAD